MAFPVSRIMRYFNKRMARVSLGLRINAALAGTLKKLEDEVLALAHDEKIRRWREVKREIRRLISEAMHKTKHHRQQARKIKDYQERGIRMPSAAEIAWEKHVRAREREKTQLKARLRKLEGAQQQVEIHGERQDVDELFGPWIL